MTATSRQVWLPASVENLRNSLTVGLYYLSIGRSPKHVPQEDYKNMRVKINPASKALLDKLVPNRFTSANEAILHALAWLSQQPKHVQTLNIEVL